VTRGKKTAAPVRAKDQHVHTRTKDSARGWAGFAAGSNQNQGPKAFRRGVMVLAAHLRTISDQIVRESTFTPRLRVGGFSDAFV
jgi:hypothetical protein